VVISGTGGNDTLVVTETPGGGVGSITYALNGTPVALTGVTSFTFDGTGSATLTVSAANGAPLVPGGIHFNGTGAGALVVDASGAPTQTVPGAVNLGALSVTYTNVPTIDINGAAAVDAAPAPDTADRATAFAGLTTQESYIQSLYLADLGRAGAQSELDSWVAQLSASGEQAVVLAIEHSAEATDHLVKSWYLAYLGRAAQGGEEAGFVTQLLQGASRSQVLGEVLGSDEFYARAQNLIGSGSADERYVQALYQVLLGRTGDAPSVQSAVGALPSAGRHAVVLGILNSAEFRTDQVAGYYNELLHRPGADTEVSGWVASGLDLATILVSFEASTEFTTGG
jgi:hypothetical protein